MSSPIHFLCDTEEPVLHAVHSSVASEPYKDVNIFTLNKLITFTVKGDLSCHIPALIFQDGPKTGCSTILQYYGLMLDI